MAIIAWDESYSVGVEKFDAQHKQLVALVNNLHDALAQKKGKEVLGKALAVLIYYTHTHFIEEEELMARSNYPGLLEHQAEHTTLKNQVMGFQAQFQQGKVGLTPDLLNFLKAWLLNHIQGTDKEYGAFFNDRGIK